MRTQSKDRKRKFLKVTWKRGLHLCLRGPGALKGRESWLAARIRPKRQTLSRDGYFDPAANSPARQDTFA